uniref:Uncharacterized protein n=1 Tax=Anopheles coluzzii TaxID=1518534 RepID=A0A8W7PWG3_ANOCL
MYTAKSSAYSDPAAASTTVPFQLGTVLQLVGDVVPVGGPGALRVAQTSFAPLVRTLLTRARVLGDEQIVHVPHPFQRAVVSGLLLLLLLLLERSASTLELILRIRGRDWDSFMRRCSSRSNGDFGNAAAAAVGAAIIPGPPPPFSWYSKLLHDSPLLWADDDLVSAVVLVTSKSRRLPKSIGLSFGGEVGSTCMSHGAGLPPPPAALACAPPAVLNTGSGDCGSPSKSSPSVVFE